MKKFLIVFLCGIILTSCNMTSAPSNSDAQSNVSQISYIKDTRTGLCFGMLNSTSYTGYEITSITCVPCDSLKNVLLIQK